MLIRVFRPRIRPGREDDFQQYVTNKGLPLVKGQPGCLDAYAGRNRFGDPAAFTIVSLWDSVESLAKFAGVEWQKPHMTEEGAAMIEEIACDHFQSFPS